MSGQPHNVHPLDPHIILPNRRPAGTVREVDGRLEVWINDPPPGGWVCAEPINNTPEGMCGMPIEDTPCTIHHPQVGA